MSVISLDTRSLTFCLTVLSAGIAAIALLLLVVYLSKLCQKHYNTPPAAAPAFNSRLTRIATKRTKLISPPPEPADFGRDAKTTFVPGTRRSSVPAAWSEHPVKAVRKHSSLTDASTTMPSPDQQQNKRKTVQFTKEQMQQQIFLQTVGREIEKIASLPNSAEESLDLEAQNIEKETARAHVHETKSARAQVSGNGKAGHNYTTLFDRLERMHVLPPLDTHTHKHAHKKKTDKRVMRRLRSEDVLLPPAMFPPIERLPPIPQTHTEECV